MIPYCSPTEQEILTLCEWATGKRCVEVGTWTGFTAARLAEVAKTLLCVDNFCGDLDPALRKRAYWDVGPEELCRAWHDRLQGRAALVIASSVQAASIFGAYRAVFDLVFIDACHTYEATLADIDAWLPLARVLCGHDYGNRDFPGVKQAIDERFPDAVIGPGTLWRTP